MSDVPNGLYYTSDHEWMRVEEKEIVVGITDHAQDALTDIVYVELPMAGDSVAEGDEFASVESVKSVSGIFAPVAGEITAVNEELEDSPELINQQPYHAGWLVRMRPVDMSQVKGLLDAAGYLEVIGE